MTVTDWIALGQAWGAPLTAFVTGGWGVAVAYLRYKKWLKQYDRAMKGPPSKPSILPVLLILGGGAAGLAQLPEARSAFAANAEQPQKKQPKEPKKGCGPGCTGVYPNCRCTGQAEKQTKISEVPTSILGDNLQPWSIEPLQTGPLRPSPS